MRLAIRPDLKLCQMSSADVAKLRTSGCFSVTAMIRSICWRVLLNVSSRTVSQKSSDLVGLWQFFSELHVVRWQGKAIHIPGYEGAPKLASDVAATQSCKVSVPDWQLLRVEIALVDLVQIISTNDACEIIVTV